MRKTILLPFLCISAHLIFSPLALAAHNDLVIGYIYNSGLSWFQFRYEKPSATSGACKINAFIAPNQRYLIGRESCILFTDRNNSSAISGAFYLNRLKSNSSDISTRYSIGFSASFNSPIPQKMYFKLASDSSYLADVTHATSDGNLFLRELYLRINDNGSLSASYNKDDFFTF